jgi:hypothetical protein
MHPELDSETESDQKNMQQTSQAAPVNPVQGNTATIISAQTPAGSRRAVFALAEGDVTITFPEELSPESVSDLADYLEIFMKKAKRGVGGIR